MKCMYYRGRRRPCPRTPAARNPRQRTATPPASNSFYGLDTEYDPGGGMVPIKQHANMWQNRAILPSQACPNLQTRGSVTPEEAVENGALYPPMFVPGAQNTYR